MTFHIQLKIKFRALFVDLLTLSKQYRLTVDPSHVTLPMPTEEPVIEAPTTARTLVNTRGVLLRVWM